MSKKKKRTNNASNRKQNGSSVLQPNHDTEQCETTLLHNNDEPPNSTTVNEQENISNDLFEQVPEVDIAGNETQQSPFIFEKDLSPTIEVKPNIPLPPSPISSPTSVPAKILFPRSGSLNKLNKLQFGSPKKLRTTINEEEELHVNWIPYFLFALSFVGLCGLHRLYMHHYTTGFIYLFSFGLLGIGTLYDFIHFQTLLEKNHVVYIHYARYSDMDKSATTSSSSTSSSVADDTAFLELYHYYRTLHIRRLLRDRFNQLLQWMVDRISGVALWMFQRLTTILLTLLPLHWLFVVIFVATFSFGWALAVGAVLFAYPQILWDSKMKKQVSIWKTLTDSPLFSPLFEYFPMVLFRTTPLDSSKRYLFGYHPHGVYSFGLFSLVFPKLSGFDRLFPGINCVIGVANSLLCIPILCTVFSWLGFIPASFRSLTSAVEQGYNVVLVPGGIAEMLQDGNDNQEIVFLRARKGFVRFAMKHGLCLVPVYGFGENNTFHRFSSFRDIRMYLSRRFRITLQLFRGRWWTLVPFKTPVTVVVGKPVDIIQDSNPSEELVNLVLEQYCQHLLDLFNSNKALYGYENKTLIIV